MLTCPGLVLSMSLALTPKNTMETVHKGLKHWCGSNPICNEPIKVSLDCLIRLLAGSVHVSPVRRHYRRSSFFILLYGLSGRQPVLPGFSPTIPLYPTPPSSLHDFPTVRSRESTPDNTSDRWARLSRTHPFLTVAMCRHPLRPWGTTCWCSHITHPSCLPLSSIDFQWCQACHLHLCHRNIPCAGKCQHADFPINGSDPDPHKLGVEEDEIDEHYVTQYSGTKAPSTMIVFARCHLAVWPRYAHRVSMQGQEKFASTWGDRSGKLIIKLWVRSPGHQPNTARKREISWVWGTGWKDVLKTAPCLRLTIIAWGVWTLDEGTRL